MKLKFKHNPCEEHINVETNDDWCPFCLMDERNSLRAENEKMREAFRWIVDSGARIYSSGGHSDSVYQAKKALGLVKL